jgi:NTE family protein
MIPKQQLPKIGLVIGSGGLKSIACIPVLEFLQEHDIPVDLLVGCSGGGIFGAMHAYGYQTSEMIQITNEFLEKKGFSKIDHSTLLSIAGLSRGYFDLTKGIMKDEPSLDMLHRIFGETLIEDLEIKTVFQATNIQTGQAEIITSGPLAEAVYASAAMYPLLPPIYFQGKWLADGAYTAPLPITEAVARGMDIIIAVMFTENISTNPTRFRESFYNINKITAQSIMKSQLALAIDFHHYEMIVVNVQFNEEVMYNDYSKIDYAIQLGKKAMEEHIEEILYAIEHFKPSNDQ